MCIHEQKKMCEFDGCDNFAVGMEFSEELGRMASFCEEHFDLEIEYEGSPTDRIGRHENTV